MDESDIEKINEIVKVALAEAIERMPSPLNEKISLRGVDSSGVELESTQIDLASLLVTGQEALKNLKGSSTSNKTHHSYCS